MSPYRLIRPLAVLAAGAAAATAYVMVVAIPQSNQTFREITFNLVSQRVETEIQPRVFFEDFPGWVLYAREEPDPGHTGWKKLIVANTAPDRETKIHLAERGRLAVNRERRTVQLVLQNGSTYTVSPRQTTTVRFPGELVLSLNPEDVFPRGHIQPGINEKTMAELRADAAEKVRNGLSPHPEVIAIQQKFSFPVACVVFAIIGLALGLTVAREGKLAGFVVGVVVIFAYYTIMFLSESLTKGHYLNMYVSRWVPNIVMGAFGLAALVWRARYIEGRLPFTVPAMLANVRLPWMHSPTAGNGPEAVPGAATHPGHGAGVRRPSSAARPPVLVIRFPRVHVPAPGLLDRYISQMYLRVVGISFLALLGLFYISTFLDRSDKIFKGQATVADVGTLLIYLTPRFVYFVIPIAALLSALVTFGLLSRNSELTVMKACGISLYRASLSVVLMSLVFSGIIFSMEQRLLARANRHAEILDSRIRGRTPRVFDAVNRQWIVGREGAIYHYVHFDPERRELARLAIYEPGNDATSLTRITTADRAQFGRGWRGHGVRVGDLTGPVARWTEYSERPLPLEPPDYFETEQPVAEMMTVAQLRRHVAELSASGVNVVHLAVEFHHKLAFPFVTLVMTLLAIPFGVSTGRRGALYAIGLGIVLALSYWIVTSLFVALGKSGLLTPVLAAWSPNIIVLGSAAYVFLTVRT